MVGDALAAPLLDVPVDAVVGDVQRAAEIPLGVGQLPLVELGERLGPGDPLAALGLPELLEVALVDLGLGVRLRGELGRRRVAPFLDEMGLDRLRVAHSSRSYGKLGQHLRAVLRHEHEILEPDAAVAVPVEARLERDDVARDELAVDAADTRLLVHLEPDAVAGGVVEAVPEHLRLGLVELRLVAVLVEEVADRDVDRAAAHARRDGSDREVERLPREPVELRDLVRRRADRERAREVREAARLAIAREEVEEDDVVRGDRARAHVVADRGLAAVGDDELVRGRAVVAERPLDGLLDPLARELLPVEHELARRRDRRRAGARDPRAGRPRRHGRRGGSPRARPRS